jgi:hypothetical protein
LAVAMPTGPAGERQGISDDGGPGRPTQSGASVRLRETDNPSSRRGRGAAASRRSIPRAAANRFAQRVFVSISLIMLLFALSDYVLYNRSFANPLMVFCIVCSLTAFIVAAIFPFDEDVAKPVIAAGMVTWSIMVFRIGAYEWDPRYFETEREPEVRTVLRRFVCIVWATLTFITTLLYVSELWESSWLAIRAQFMFASITDLFHTAFLHSLYFTDPDSQPTVPFRHTGGMRVGPPPASAYLPTLYILAMAYYLTPEVRARLSGLSGARKLSIALGQIRAGEIPELPTPPADSSGGGGGAGRPGRRVTTSLGSAGSVGSGSAPSVDEPSHSSLPLGTGARGAAAGVSAHRPTDDLLGAQDDGEQLDLRALQRQLRDIEDARERVMDRIHVRLQ